MGVRLDCSAATVSGIENGKAGARVYADYLATLADTPHLRKRTPGGGSRIGRRKLTQGTQIDE